MYPSYTSIYHAIPSYDMSGYQGGRIPDETTVANGRKRFKILMVIWRVLDSRGFKLKPGYVLDRAERTGRATVTVKSCISSCPVVSQLPAGQPEARVTRDRHWHADDRVGRLSPGRPAAGESESPP